MQIIIEIINEFLELDDATTAMEYALMGGLIAVVIILAVSSVGISVNGLFSYVADQVAGVVQGL